MFLRFFSQLYTFRIKLQGYKIFRILGIITLCYTTQSGYGKAPLYYNVTSVLPLDFEPTPPLQVQAFGDFPFFYTRGRFGGGDVESFILNAKVSSIQTEKLFNMIPPSTSKLGNTRFIPVTNNCGKIAFIRTTNGKEYSLLTSQVLNGSPLDFTITPLPIPFGFNPENATIFNNTLGILARSTSQPNAISLCLMEILENDEDAPTDNSFKIFNLGSTIQKQVTNEIKFFQITDNAAIIGIQYLVNGYPLLTSNPSEILRFSLNGRATLKHSFSALDFSILLKDGGYTLFTRVGSLENHSIEILSLSSNLQVATRSEPITTTSAPAPLITFLDVKLGPSLLFKRSPTSEFEILSEKVQLPIKIKDSIDRMAIPTAAFSVEGTIFVFGLNRMQNKALQMSISLINPKD